MDRLLRMRLRPIISTAALALLLTVPMQADSPVAQAGTGSSAAPIYSTYLGGTALDYALGTFADSQGNFYVTGPTASTNFPTTANAVQRSYGGGDADVFVAKFGPSGNLVYSTYLGGSGHDEGRGVAVDAAGDIYVSGFTQSSNFPTHAAYSPSLKGGEDAFLSKISPTGALVFSTYFGGSGTDSALANLAIDSAGSVYFTGETNSSDLPTTTGAFSRTEAGDMDVYVTKFTSSGSLAYSTYLGGPGFDDGLAITVDGSGDAFVTGKASPGFPITPGAFDSTQNGGYDMFVTKLNPSGTALIFSTYLGGNDWDEGLGIGVDASGNSYVTGNVASTNFPTTPGAYQTRFGGSRDTVIAKLNATGTALVYSTYLSGRTSWVEGDGLAVDANGDAYISGHLGSPDFPVTANAIQPTFGGYVDGFLTKIDPTGSKLLYSTYFGGSDWDGAMTMTIDGSGNACLSGGTSSTNYPVTSGAYQPTMAGGGDVMVTKLPTPNQPYPPVNTSPPVVSGTPKVGSTLTASTGSWNNNPTSYAYQWQTATSAAGPWGDISGATSSSYTVASSDAANYLRVSVTATNADGSATASSSAVGPVSNNSGTMTFTIASGADDGDVAANDMAGPGTYPPPTTPKPWDNGTSYGVRRSGPLYGGYEVRTGLLRFNTSSLPAAATITSATLRLYVTSARSDNNRNLLAEWFNGAAWPINASDYTATPSSSASTGVAINTLIVSAFNSLTLQNLSSINRSGYTTIRLHVDGGQPRGENGAMFSSFEGGPSQAAQLVINYSL